MEIEQAEELAAYLLDNGYSEEVLSKYTVDELLDIQSGNTLNIMEYLATTSKDDDIEFYQHFDTALTAEINSRKDS